MCMHGDVITLQACNTDHPCVHACFPLQGMAFVTKACKALAAASVVLAAAAVAIISAKGAVGPLGVVLLALGGAALWASQKLDQFKYDRFINSTRTWHKEGGLSLVKGDPIVLDRRA